MFERGITVLGLGYIGLPTSAILASHGLRVRGVDVNPATVESINAGHVHIGEPDLEAAVAGAVARGALTAHLDVPPADAFLIAVPTPLGTGKQPDLGYVREATTAIAGALTGGEVVILESTSPPGTTRQISQWLGEARPDLRFPHDHPDDPDVFVAHCPERVLPGRIMLEMVTNDRLVGGLTDECARRAAALYRVFCRSAVVTTDAASAEMAKLVENSFRDVNIAFANELASVCEDLDLDVWKIVELANMHPRVNVLRPGPGVGGHCIAVDPWFIVAASPEHATLIRTARETNDGRPAAIAAKASEAAPERSTVACLGLAFKANVDDLRESPALDVTRQLAQERPDLTILAVEPHLRSAPPQLDGFANVRFTTLDEAVSLSEVVVLLVDHTAFLAVDPGALSGKTVIDTRGVWPQAKPVS